MRNYAGQKIRCNRWQDSNIYSAAPQSMGFAYFSLGLFNFIENAWLLGGVTPLPQMSAPCDVLDE